ncbi:carbohydrate ABC transporter permease [Candidatus Bipolaricaulota bacterium]|nr:carbohydrate ABC transporter permease [Candidatus Bipolaricaulota bacterium]
MPRPRLGLALLLALVMVFVLFPVYWMVTTSVKVPLEYATRDPTWFPTRLTGEHYLALWTDRAYRYLGNTVVVSLSATALALSAGLMAAYALARFRFPAKLDVLFLLWVLLVRMAPPVVMAIPLYTTLRAFGLLNTHFGLVIVYQIYVLPYAIWMMLGFVREVPREVEEAAEIDGASRWRTLTSVVLPLVRPGLVATAIFCLIMTWNEFLYALLFLRTPEKFTLPIHIANFITEYEILWGELMAIGLMSSFPILLLSGYVQRHLLKGFAMQLK